MAMCVSVGSSVHLHGFLGGSPWSMRLSVLPVDSKLYRIVILHLEIRIYFVLNPEK